MMQSQFHLPKGSTRLGLGLVLLESRLGSGSFFFRKLNDRLGIKNQKSRLSIKSSASFTSQPCTHISPTTHLYIKESRDRVRDGGPPSFRILEEIGRMSLVYPHGIFINICRFDVDIFSSPFVS